MNAVEVYESLSRPPREALKTIEAGKLKGKTDINPQWRYKAMTEKFGLVGIGWKYEIQKLWAEHGAGNEVLAFAQVAVFVKDGEKWSDPIVGIGGSKLVQIEKGQPVSNDEGYKMAVTDAFSTSLKMLGVAADIYAGRWDGSKYSDSHEPQTTQTPVQTVQNAFNGTVVNQQSTQQSNEAKQLYDLGLEVSNLLKSVNPQGYPMFNEQEVDEWKAVSQEKYKAKDLDGLKDVVTQIKDRIARKQQPAQPQPEIF